MPLDDATYARLADDTLDALFERIDEALGDELEVDMDGGILTIDMDGGAQFIVNKNAPNRELWLSSPASGASHYAWDDGRQAWVSTRGEATSLHEQLAADLEKLTGTRPDLG